MVWYCQFDVSPVNYSDSDLSIYLYILQHPLARIMCRLSLSLFFFFVFVLFFVVFFFFFCFFFFRESERKEASACLMNAERQAR